MNFVVKYLAAELASHTKFLPPLFIGLKLTGHIDWSWWWILAPVWLPVLVVMAAVAFLPDGHKVLE